MMAASRSNHLSLLRQEFRSVPTQHTFALQPLRPRHSPDFASSLRLGENCVFRDSLRLDRVDRTRGRRWRRSYSRRLPTLDLRADNRLLIHVHQLREHLCRAFGKRQQLVPPDGLVAIAQFHAAKDYTQPQHHTNRGNGTYYNAHRHSL